MILRSPNPRNSSRVRPVETGALIFAFALVMSFSVLTPVRPAAASPQDDIRLELEKKAEYWAQNGREDLAAETYRHLLFLDPSNRRALIGLSEALILTGHKDQAEEFIRKVRALDPQDPSLPFFSREMALGSRWSEAINQARIADSQRHYQKALDHFREAFGPLPPPPDFAVEYYHVLLQLNGGKEKALSELEDLVRKYPESRHYQLAYGEILSYHPDMRHKAIRVLKPLALSPSSVSRRAARDWRQTLIWAGDDPAYLKELSDFAKFRSDPKILALRERARRRILQEGPRPQAAYKALHEGRFEEAETDFRDLLRQDPGNGSYWIGLASAESGQGRFDRARRALENARRARLDPKDRATFAALDRRIGFWTLMDEARSSMANGDRDRARARYEKAADIDPFSPAPINGLASLALEDGESSRALILYRRALHLDPRDSQAWAGVLSALSAEHRFAEARKIIDSTPIDERRAFEAGHPEIRVAEANVYANTGDRNRALKILEDTQKSLPNPTYAQQITLAWGYYALHEDGPLARILDRLAQAQDLPPGLSRQRTELEHLHLLDGVNRDLAHNNVRSALDRVETARRAHPDDSFYPRETAAVYYASGQFEQAYRILRQIGPGSSLDTYDQAVSVAIRARHPVQARIWADDARKRWPGNSGTLMIESRVLASEGHRPEALALLRAAHARNPGDPRILLGLARMESEDNRLSDARKHALQALENATSSRGTAGSSAIAIEAQTTLDDIDRRKREFDSEHFEFLLGETVFSQYTQYYYSQIGGFIPVGTATGPGGTASPVYLHAFVFGSAFTFQYHPTPSSGSFLSQSYIGGTPAVGLKIPTGFGSWEGDVGWGIALHDQTLTPPGTVTGLFLQTDLDWNLFGGALDLFANYTGYINYVYFQSRYLHPAWNAPSNALRFALGPEFIVQGNENYSAYMGGVAFQLYVQPLRSSLLLDGGLLGSSAYPGVGGYEGFSWYFYY